MLQPPPPGFVDKKRFSIFQNPCIGKWTCLLAVLIVVFSFSACTKKGISESASPYELITGTQWRLAALYLTDSPYVERTNFTSQFYSACELSDMYHFQKDSVVSRKPADTTTPCRPFSHTVPDDGAMWYLDTTTNHVVIMKQTFTTAYRYDCEILTLSRSTMELRSYFRNYFNEPSAYIFSFQATP